MTLATHNELFKYYDEEAQTWTQTNTKDTQKGRGLH